MQFVNNSVVHVPSYQALRTCSYCALYLRTDCGAHTASVRYISIL